MEGRLEAKEKDRVSGSGVAESPSPVALCSVLLGSPSHHESRGSGPGGWGSKSSGLAGKGEAVSITQTGLDSGTGLLLSQFTGTGETPSC